MKKLFYVVFVSSGLSLLFITARAQKASDTVLSGATLETCVQYALKHYPQVQQALLDEQITDGEVRSKLADWYPQINFNGSYQDNIQRQTIVFNGNAVASGTFNTSMVGVSGTQNLFNRDVLLATRTKNDVRTQSKQATISQKIDVTVNVSKAFYDVLLTQKQIEVLTDDIVRLERNLKDAYNQYQGGLVDKTDYKRATISLNNSKAEKRADVELLKARYTVLKQRMGYTASGDIQLLYDSARMEGEINIDTTATMDFNRRIEYQYLLTRKRLQEANLRYNRWSYLPAISAFGAYGLYFYHNQFSKLYDKDYPASYAGVQLSVPIFQGTRRTQNIRVAELQVTRTDWDILSLQTSINSEYAQAMAAYKANLNNYYVLRENLALARDVFNTIELQYRSGVKTYLELISAETDLRTAQSNYSNALYQVLSSKLDVQKALGTVQY